MTFQILEGDWREVATTLRDESVHCVVTSPPYWGLRDYGIAGQLGLERTPDKYVEKIVAGFREVHRILRKDGTLWLNLGDCYATGAGKVGRHPGGGKRGERWVGRRDDSKGRGTSQRCDGRGGHTYFGPMTQPNRLPLVGYKAKDLVGIPWLVAFALRSDGWYLRSDIIWAKPSPMPESITDRPTKAHEYIFLLTKSKRYYYDADAVKEPVTAETLRDNPKDAKRRDRGYPGAASRSGGRLGGDFRNKRSVWTVAAQPFKDAHFATFPPKLIEPCILAGSPRGGVVLDPFSGAGTTGLVCSRLGRDYVGIELNPVYAEMSRKRITADAPLFEEGIA